MPLVRLSEPFDRERFIFELKHDGFRGLAYIDGHHCELISRRKHVLQVVAVSLYRAGAPDRRDQAVIDGEIVVLGPMAAADSGLVVSS